MKYVFEGLFIIGIVALIVTIIKYPKDVANGIASTAIGFITLPFIRIWNVIQLFLLPLELLILYLEKKFEVNYLTKYIDREPSTTKKKTKERKQINFQNFRKFIIVNSTSEQIESELNEADECCPEVNLEDHSIARTDSYSVIEIPRTGFYGYNFMIQWLTNNFTKNQIVGLASNGRTRFLTISNTEGDNDMIGRTQTGKKFWVSMYDDLDKKQFLRINPELELNSELTTESLEKMVKNAM
jgi:hypothetical protein